MKGFTDFYKEHIQRFTDFYLKAKARIWPGLYYAFHIRSTAALCNLAGLKWKAGAPLKQVIHTKLPREERTN